MDEDAAREAREAWGSRIGFILAAAGSAIGLGNVWRFPYVVGENGGAAFVLVYLVCIALVGAPVFLAELVIGRRTQRNPVGAFGRLRPGSRWPLLGAMGVLAGFLILSFYSVVAGWTLGYTVESVLGRASSPAGPDASAAFFTAFSASPLRSVGYHVVFMLATILIVARGIQSGIERASKIMMPLLLTLLGVLIVRGLLLPGASAGIDFLLRPDFTLIGPDVVFSALGQAFFTLSLGMGAMITYGSYLSRQHNLVRSTGEVAGMDTGVAVVAGFAIFPALFALGLEPAQGPGLIFVTLPNVFAQITGGWFFGFLFFLLMLLAALTSSISLLEVCAAYFIDERGWARTKAAWLLGTIILLLGVPAALSFGVLSDWSLASLLGATSGQGLLGNIRALQLDWFSLIEHVTSNYMLPLGGLLIAVFVAYVWKESESVAEIYHGYPGFRGVRGWLNLLRYVCPLVVAQILIMGVLNEFLPSSPDQPAYFPGLQEFATTLTTWFGWIDILVAAVVVAVSVWQMARPGGGEQAV